MIRQDTKPRSRLELDHLCINTIRFLSVDAVQKANSGHPGMPMGAAPMAYVLWSHFLKHNPANPGWFDRDRFILSAGHASMLLYSMLYLTGYPIPLDQIQHFRQWESITPGHPERGLTPGVEVTTGPLGQGFGNAVGMAIAEARLAERYNRPGFEVIHHHTYAIASDGDMMEGVASEAASLAGHLRLGRLIVLYDSNAITLSASTRVSFTEDVLRRFQAYGWHTKIVQNGNDVDSITRAVRAAYREIRRPSLVLVKSHIGYGSPNKQDTWQAHGSPLGEEEVRLSKESLGWPVEPPFYIPDTALRHLRKAIDRGRLAEARWKTHFSRYQEAYPQLAGELLQMINGEIPPGWDVDIPRFEPSAQISTRAALGKVINASAPRLPALMGGSGDLDPSTHTALTGLGDFGSPASSGGDMQGSAGGGWSYAGRNIHFGVREHGMGAILNGLAAHGGTLPFGATFLVFSDYMRPAIRLAALMKAHVLFIFTHDSISLGEDGPTHQPVEHLLSLRAIPGMLVLRPADANETTAAWRVAVNWKDGPVCLVLSRQSLPILDLKAYPQIPGGVERGGYILAQEPEGSRPDIVLVATGAEVHLALLAAARLGKQGILARVVSLPGWSLFERQPADYRQKVIPPGTPWLAIEAGASLGWRSYLGSSAPVVGIDHFGASAPGEVLLREFGFTVEAVCERALALLKSEK